MSFKFGDDRFSDFGWSEGQSLPFPIDNHTSHYYVRCGYQKSMQF